MDEAGRLIEKDGPSLAILEHDPPRIDGVEMCRAIRQQENDREQGRRCFRPRSRTSRGAHAPIECRSRRTLREGATSGEAMRVGVAPPPPALNGRGFA